MPKYTSADHGRFYDSLQSVMCAVTRLVLQLPSRSPLTDLMSSELHRVTFPDLNNFKVAVFLLNRALRRQGLATMYFF